MAYATIKKVVRFLGLYRQARWLNRHLLNRKALREEEAELAFYSKLLHKTDLVFDVGANCGKKSSLFLRLGTTVVAFEPQPDCMEELKALCGSHKRLITIQSALSSKAGIGKFYVRTHRDKSGLVKDWQKHVVSNVEESVLEVPLTTLDEMIRIHGRPHYTKIDVEGHEYEVLSGLSQPIPLISFEYHFSDSGANTVRDCIDYLSKLGPVSLNITPAEKLLWGCPEWLDKESFLSLFYNDSKGKPGFGYGDIWVKSQLIDRGCGEAY